MGTDKAGGSAVSFAAAMQIREIQSLIDSLCRADEPDSELAELLSAVAESRGEPADPDDLDKGVRFLCEYIHLVPYMLTVAQTAAETVGLRDEMDRILTAVTRYWREDNDVIPDHMGAVGLLDDAYCTLNSLQTVSDQYRLITGKFLFPNDLSAANRAVRQIIGEPYAPELDRFVMETLNQAGLSEAVKRLARGAKRQDLDANSTIWRHNPVESMDTGQLGFLGIDGEESSVN